MLVLQMDIPMILLNFPRLYSDVKQGRHEFESQVQCRYCLSSPVKSPMGRIGSEPRREMLFFLNIWTHKSTYATSPTTTPKIQQFARKNPSADTQSPGTNVLSPKNSSWKPCCSQAAWVRIHNNRAAMPSLGRWRKEECGRYRGRRTRYQRKYCPDTSQ